MNTKYVGNPLQFQVISFMSPIRPETEEAFPVAYIIIEVWS